MIDYIPGFFDPKVIVRLSAWLDIEAQSKIFFAPSLLYQEVFRHLKFWGRLEVVVVFFKSYTYNFLVNG